MHYIPHSQPWISEAEKAAAQAVLDSALLSKHDGIPVFERDFAQYLKNKYALFTGNGSQAQILLLMAMDLRNHDEVILPTYVCEKVYRAVKIAGANPILCDVGNTWLLTPDQVRNKITSNTKAIILPHVNGLNGWQETFRDFGIPVIEDICQSLGDSMGPGTNTDRAFISFHGTKPLVAGEGGMLFLNDENEYQKILRIRKENPGFTVGNELNSSVAHAQLKRWADILKRRQEIADIYDHQLPQRLNARFISLKNSTNFRYLLWSDKDFQQIRMAFLDRGIHIRQGIDNLIHRDIGLSDTEFPNACDMFKHTFSIPILPQISEAECARVISATRELAELEII